MTGYEKRLTLFYDGGLAVTRAVLILVVAVAMWLAVAAESASGQWPDASQPQRGELLVQITGINTTSDMRFGPDGTARSLAEVYAFELDDRVAAGLDTLDAALPGLLAPLGITPSEPSTLGALKFDVLFERTTVPIHLELGVTEWLSVVTAVPIIHGRGFSGALIEDGSASAGAFPEAVDQFFDGLASGIAELESIVAADTLPVVRQQEAQALLADAQALETGLSGLRDLPYVPTDSSVVGRQITSIYDGIRDGFSEFALEVPPIVLGSPIDGSAASEQFITEAGFGIESPRKRSTGIKFGDIEAGLRVQPLNTFRGAARGSRALLRYRLRLGALWRFPTGSPPLAERLTDLGTGSGQADLELHAALDLSLGSRLWLSLSGYYTLQFDAEVERLLTTRAGPIQLGAATARVNWDPGDVRRLAVLPRFNFTRNITFAGIFLLTHHGRDEYVPTSPGVGGPFGAADLEEGTEFTTRTFGFAARYAATEWHGGRREGLPVEVELRYTRTAGASDGFVPQENTWQVGLRYYQAIFR